MRYLKKYQLFERKSNDIISNINDILIELDHEGFETSCEDITVNWAKNKIIEILIHKKDYHISLISWGDIKETVFHILDYLTLNDMNNIRYFSDGIEWGIGFKSESDFEGVGDDITQHQLRILVTLT